MCFVFTFLAVFLSITLSDGNETFGGGVFGLTFLMQFAIVGLLTVAQMVFVFYGIIGAIMTYLGKEFRYFIIANRLEKR